MITESRSPAETEAAGRELATHLAPGDVVVLEGDLAAGKTVFVRGLVAGLGGEAAEVSSPTFVIVQTYEIPAGPVQRLHHVDLYRLTAAGPQALRETGLEEILSDGGAVTAVEWPTEAVFHWLPRRLRPWHVRLTVAESGDSRRIEIDRPDG